MGLILELLAREGRDLSDILLDFPSYSMIKDKISLERPLPEDFYAKLRDSCMKTFNDYSCNELDGIKIYNNEEWLHIRSSNTDPAVRIMSESFKSKRSEELLEIGKKLVLSL